MVHPQDPHRSTCLVLIWSIIMFYAIYFRCSLLFQVQSIVIVDTLTNLANYLSNREWTSPDIFHCGTKYELMTYSWCNAHILDWYRNLTMYDISFQFLPICELCALYFQGGFMIQYFRLLNLCPFNNKFFPVQARFEFAQERQITSPDQLHTARLQVQRKQSPKSNNRWLLCFQRQVWGHREDSILSL